MKSATDREIDAVENEIASLRCSPRPREDTDRLQRLYLRRDELQKRQFKALQRKIRKMPK